MYQSLNAPEDTALLWLKIQKNNHIEACPIWCYSASSKGFIIHTKLHHLFLCLLEWRTSAHVDCIPCADAHETFQKEYRNGLEKGQLTSKKL